MAEMDREAEVSAGVATTKLGGPDQSPVFASEFGRSSMS